jgi:hypothetical protein
MSTLPPAGLPASFSPRTRFTASAVSVILTCWSEMPWLHDSSPAAHAR